jgi:hypothetical protein
MSYEGGSWMELIQNHSEKGALVLAVLHLGISGVALWY